MRLMIAFVLGFCLTIAAYSNALADWKAGTARAVITPQQPVWLSGYAGKRVPQGKLHDLWIKVLALEDGQGQRAVVLTSDLIGFSRPAYLDLCRRLNEKYQLTPDQVMLTFSHTHSGPVLRESLLDYFPLDHEALALVNDYSRQLEDQIVDVVGKALGNLAPAVLATGTGTATFAVNRRNNREAEVPQLLARDEALQGPVDHTVPVLSVRTPQGKLKAVLFGYACHNTTLSGLEYNGDWAGFAQLAIEARHPGAQAMFYAGCGADQNPLPRRKVELCEKYGQMLAAAVNETLSQVGTPLAPHLRTWLVEIELPFEKVLGREDIQPFAGKDNLRGRWATRLLARLDAGESFANTYPYPVRVWKLGERQLWIGLTGEVVIDFALRFKSEFGQDTWVAAYTSEMLAYIPSRRVWLEGGYEGRGVYEYGIPAERWTIDVEERIAKAVHQLVEQVNRK